MTIAATPSLAMLQARFQSGLLDGDNCVLDEILDSPREARKTLFEVYRNAYAARLVEIIQHDFERLHAWLGDEVFEAAARAYVASHPSRHANARWYSQGLPAFLKTAAPWRDAPELADLAMLERALNDAFDAADGPVLKLEALAAVAPEDWSALRFRAHPSAARIDLRTNAADIWIALKDERTPPAATQSSSGSPAHLIVWRQDLIPKFRDMPDEEAMMWDEAAAGAPFGVLCEMLSFRADPGSAPLRAATLLQGWIACGLIGEAV
jgi:hypothetical protein